MVADVREGLLTIEAAARDYGVVIRPIDPEVLRFEVDEHATRALRERKRAG